MTRAHRKALIRHMKKRTAEIRREQQAKLQQQAKREQQTLPARRRARPRRSMAERLGLGGGWFETFETRRTV